MTEFVALLAVKIAFLIALSVRIFSYVVRDNNQLSAEAALQERLKRLSADTGLRLADLREERHRLCPQRAALEGEIHGARAQIGLDLIPHGGHLRLGALEITLQPEHGLDIGLSVLSRDASLFGPRPWPRSADAPPEPDDASTLLLGDDAFDARFLTAARSPERALQVLTADVRGLLGELTALPETTLKLTDASLTIRVDLRRAWLSEDALVGTLEPHLAVLPERLRRLARALHEGHTRAELFDVQRVAPVQVAASA